LLLSMRIVRKTRPRPRREQHKACSPTEETRKRKRKEKRNKCIIKVAQGQENTASHR
jgi:hypothetical protein